MGPALMEDAVEEVVVRFPPEDPARLLRAALVCKRWYRLISGAGFRRRFCEFHGKAPMLGFFYNSLSYSCFVPISSTCPPLIGDHHLTAIDARHGRVLLFSGPLYSRIRPWENAFVVWDPMTGERRELPLLPRAFNSPNSWNAAVLCAATPTGTCDHLDCHCGPFFVVLLGIEHEETFVYLYSSETGAWSEPTYVQQPYLNVTPLVPIPLVGNTLCFVLQYNKCILKYDLGSQESATIDLPSGCSSVRIVLMGMEHGRLGCAMVDNFKLYFWSTKAGPDEATGWTQSKIIELKTVLPIGAHYYSPIAVGVADGIGVIFLSTSDGIFTIDPKAVRVTKVCKEEDIVSIFPYMSFYTPAL